ncbi:MAG: flippase-like domain-containing protein [Anaerolineae bacterium]|nr:flippase-like domain-containing protein [Anaerolineae bacterium]
MRKYRNQVLVGLLFITLVLIGVIAVTGADDLADKLSDYPLWLFVPVLALKIGNWALRYMEWRYFLGVIGVRTVRGLSERPAPNAEVSIIRERDSVVLWIAGLAMSISPGKLAEVLKALVLKHLTGVDFARAAPVIFMERLVDGLAIIPMTAVAMIALGGDVDTGDVSLSYVRAALIGVTVVMCGIMVVVQFRGLAHWALDLVANWPGIRRIHAPLVNLYDSVYDLIKIRHLIPTVLFGMGAYATDIAGFYLLLTGLGLAGTGTLFFQAAFILGFSVIVASLSALPGGAGGREITVGARLTGLVGLSKVDSGTGTFLIGLWQL